MNIRLICVGLLVAGCPGPGFSAGVEASGGAGTPSAAAGGASTAGDATGGASAVPGSTITGFVREPKVLVEATAFGDSLDGSFTLLVTAQSAATAEEPTFRIVSSEGVSLLDPLATNHDGMTFPMVLDEGATKSGSFSFHRGTTPSGLCDGPIKIVATTGTATIESDEIVATCD